MKLEIKFPIWRILSLLLFVLILVVFGCGRSSSVDNKLNAVESIMECRPDSALNLIDVIKVSDLKNASQKARYALLRSVALDKNYVDKTSFDVLQPAIDYYLKKGTPDEKLRTYYYQGRIYQNRNERDNALHSYMKGLDVADYCQDSLTIAKILVAQCLLYKSFYDYEGYTDSYLKAAKIYHSKLLGYLESECLLGALNGLNIIKDRERADSVMRILDRFDSLETSQKRMLHDLKMTYFYQFGSKQDLKRLMEASGDSVIYDANDLLNRIRAYHRFGDNENALKLLAYLDAANVRYDTLKYLSIRYPIYESVGKYAEALSAYKDFSGRLEAINSSKFEQKSQAMEERHRMELEAEREAGEHSKTKWRLGGAVGVLVLIIIIMVLSLRSYQIKKNLALERARATEAENGKLKSEKELALEKARSAELENGKLKAENDLALERARTTEAENGQLKSEKELALERARSAELENKNLQTEKEKLQLERDKKALEAENLAHRVKELEGESEELKELLESQKEMPVEVRRAIQKRVEMLNSYLASQISDHKEFEKAYDDWVEELTANKEEFMDSNRLAFQASHPAFIKYFADHGLTVSELNYVCLYAIGLRGKDVGNYMKMRSHVNVSSAIRRKLGIDKHETNIGIYVRKKLQEL